MPPKYLDNLGNIFKEKVAAILESNQAELDLMYKNEPNAESIIQQQQQTLGDRLTKAYNTLCFELKRERILQLRDQNLLIISFDLVLFYLNPDNTKDTTNPPFCQEFAQNCIKSSKIRQNDGFESLYCRSLEELIKHGQSQFLEDAELRNPLKVDEYLLLCSEASQKTQKTIVDQILSQSFLFQQDSLIQEEICQRIAHQEFVRQEYLSGIIQSCDEDEEVTQIFEKKVANDFKENEEQALANRFQNLAKMPKSTLKVSEFSAFSPLQKQANANQGGLR